MKVSRNRKGGSKLFRLDRRGGLNWFRPGSNQLETSPQAGRCLPLLVTTARPAHDCTARIGSGP
eukprot:1526388-Rhodomonas_salina.2